MCRISRLVLVVLCSLVCATVVMSTSYAGAYTYSYNDGIFTGTLGVSGTDVDPNTGLINTDPNILINQSYPLAVVSQPWSHTSALTVDSFSITGAGFTFSMATDPAPHYDSVNVTVDHSGQIVDWTWTIYDGAWPSDSLAYLVLVGGPGYVGDAIPRPDQENLYILKPSYDPISYRNTGTWTGSPDALPQFVPEPSTMILLSIGMLGFAIYGKRRASKQS